MLLKFMYAMCINIGVKKCCWRVELCICTC